MTAPRRVYIVAPTDDFVARVGQALRSAFVCGGSTDPTGIRQFVQQGPADAVVISESVSPDAVSLAKAFRSALGEDTALVVLTRDVRPLEAGSPFDAAVRFPIAPKVFISNIKRAIRGRRRSKSDDATVAVEVEMRCLRLHEKTHYDVLGVPHDAGVDAIKAAYDKLSLQFHPDRLRGLNDELRQKAMELYFRIGEAYRVLRSPNARMRYDHGHEPEVAPGTEEGPQRLADLSTNASARKYLDLAQKAVIAGNRKMALAHLRFAATQDPDNALIAQKLAELNDNV